MSIHSDWYYYIFFSPIRAFDNDHAKISIIPVLMQSQCCEIEAYRSADRAGMNFFSTVQVYILRGR